VSLDRKPRTVHELPQKQSPSIAHNPRETAHSGGFYRMAGSSFHVIDTHPWALAHETRKSQETLP
jgi:hypothetical protein